MEGGVGRHQGLQRWQVRGLLGMRLTVARQEGQREALGLRRGEGGGEGWVHGLGFLAVGEVVFSVDRYTALADANTSHSLAQDPFVKVQCTCGSSRT